MNQLVDNALIYGRLLTVSEPHLIDRYNRALKAFGWTATGLSRFGIDMTGFSPEIAAELGAPDYLDPNGVNRRFIILTPDQEHLPVVHTQFSNTAGLMHAFFEANAAAINVLTLKDVIFGEIEDSISQVEDIEDLLSINEVTFNVMSAEAMLAKAAELRRLVDRLENAPDAWRDNALLERMVELARETGDIRRNALVPHQFVFRHDAFWTSHFGGVFVFIDERQTTVICDPAAPGFRRSRPWQVSYIALDDPVRIFEFLVRTGRIDLPAASWVEPSGYFSHRAHMAIMALIARTDQSVDLRRIDPVWLQTWIHRHAGLVSSDGTYPFFQEMIRQIATNGQIRVNEIAPHRRFQIIRARPGHRDVWLTSRLIATMVPFDVVSRFVFDKQGFYKAYETWPPLFRDYVVAILNDGYLRDKQGFRKKLYGIGEVRNA